MAERIKGKMAKRRVGALDRAMAAFLAAAVGFVLLVVPAAVMPAAPLSGGRLALAMIGAILTFLGAAALLRALGAPPPARGRKPAEVASEAPRLRRADAHPDAPSRSPILAGRELGVPLDEVAIGDQRPAADLAEVENVDFEAEWERPLPGFIDEEPRRDEAEPVTWEAVDDAEEQVEPVAQDHGRGDEIAAPEAPAGDIPFWIPEDVAPTEPAVEPASVEAATPAEELPQAVPFRKSRGARSAGTETLDTLSEALPGGPADGAGIPALVERFETGLAKRPRPSRRGDADAGIDQRLRIALGDLKKMSGRR